MWFITGHIVPHIQLPVFSKDLNTKIQVIMERGKLEQTRE